MKQQKRVYHTLDGMRGVAALIVVMFHMTIHSYWKPPSGFLAVDLFFVLSGFVLAEAYTERLDQGMSFKSFMGKRLFRLWPLYIVGGVLSSGSTVVAVIQHHKSPLALIVPFLGLFYIPVPSAQGLLFQYNSPVWSLMFELIANAAMVLFWRQLTTRALLAVILVSACGVIYTAVSRGCLDYGATVATSLDGLSRTMFSFSLGIVLWRYKPKPSSINPWIPVSILAIILLFAPFGLPSQIFDPIAVIVLFPGLIWIGAATEAKGFARWTFAFLGGISYALYVIHLPVLGPLGNLISTGLHVAHTGTPPWISLILMAGLIGLAWGLNWVDVRFRNRVAGWIEGRRERGLRPEVGTEAGARIT